MRRYFVQFVHQYTRICFQIWFGENYHVTSSKAAAKQDHNLIFKEHIYRMGTLNEGIERYSAGKQMILLSLLQINQIAMEFINLHIKQ
jgi:hypothetical protein